MVPYPEKVATVSDCCICLNVSEFESFLGFTWYYQICQFAGIATPLHALTNKGVAFVLITDC